jgi:hypothetical protein
VNQASALAAMTLDAAAADTSQVRDVRFPVIDYRAHPAFAPLAGPYIYDDELIRRAVERIDAVHAQFVARGSASQADANLALSEIGALANALRQHAREVAAPVLALEWLGSALNWTLADLHYEYVRLLHLTAEAHVAALDPAHARQLQELRARGLYIADLDDRDYGDIVRLVEPCAAELRTKVAAQPAQRAVFSPSRVSPLGRAIQRALARAGVLEVVTGYKRNRMRILGTGVEYSSAQQVWHSGIYADCGLRDSPLRYLHVDQADHLPKAMIYATPVTENNGPTGLIPGSNRWARSEFLFRVHKGLDRVSGERYGPYLGGSEYRVTARSPELRKIFMQLPRAFQGTSHFGDDVVADSDLARDLAAREFKFLCARRGRVLVFDGGRTLHRGSLVAAGDRLALQVGFVNVNDRKLRTQIAGGSHVRRLLKRAAHLARLATRP